MKEWYYGIAGLLFGFVGVTIVDLIDVWQGLKRRN